MCLAKDNEKMFNNNALSFIKTRQQNKSFDSYKFVDPATKYNESKNDILRILKSRGPKAD